MVDVTLYKSRTPITSTMGKLRDPFIVKANGVYYAFGSEWKIFRSTSKNLAGEWTPILNAVEYPSDFDCHHWAPEVHEYNGAYYMFTTYKSTKNGRRGCAIFRSDNVEGPYRLHSDGHITSSDIDAIDGTLYIDRDGQPWMVYVHEWVSTDDKIGRMACAKLSSDLKSLISEPIELFRADDASWAKEGVTDGCFVYTCTDSSLLMIWSNFSRSGYCIGVAKSDSGNICGPWEQKEELLFKNGDLGPYDGGHGMFFYDYEGKMWLSLHSPNNVSYGRVETPVFIPVKEENNTIVWDL